MSESGRQAVDKYLDKQINLSRSMLTEICDKRGQNHIGNKESNIYNIIITNKIISKQVVVRLLTYERIKTKNNVKQSHECYINGSHKSDHSIELRNITISIGNPGLIMMYKWIIMWFQKDDCNDGLVQKWHLGTTKCLISKINPYLRSFPSQQQAWNPECQSKGLCQY